MPQKQKESAEGILCSSWNCCMSGNRLGGPNLVQNWLRRKQCEDCTVPSSGVLAAELPGFHCNQSLQPCCPPNWGPVTLPTNQIRCGPLLKTTQISHKLSDWSGTVTLLYKNNMIGRYCDIFITWEKWNKDNSSLTERILKCRWRWRKCLSPPERIGQKRG